jgi:hypothetical protein
MTKMANMKADKGSQFSKTAQFGSQNGVGTEKNDSAIIFLLIIFDSHSAVFCRFKGNFVFNQVGVGLTEHYNA